MATKIHPTAIIDPSAQIGADVEIGPYAVVEADTVIGDSCRLMGNCTVRQYTRLGRRNVLHPHAVLGGEPQDLKFDPATVSHLEIGDDNTFRECVTLHRATGEHARTVVGDSNYFMVCSHVGHNSVVGSNCVFVNGSSLAGHVELADRVILSANVGVHQFCWVGRMVMSEGNSVMAMHVPPYCMCAGFSTVAGLNLVGLRRSPHISNEDIAQIKEAYRLTYRSGLTAPKALAEMDAQTHWGPAADEFRQFVRRVLEARPPHRRGLASPRVHFRHRGN